MVQLILALLSCSFGLLCQIGQLNSSFLRWKIANSDFPLYIFDNFPAIVNSVVLISHFLFSVVARKLSMTGSIRIFEN